LTDHSTEHIFEKLIGCFRLIDEESEENCEELAYRRVNLVIQLRYESVSPEEESEEDTEEELEEEQGE